MAIAVHEGPQHRYVYSNRVNDRAVGERPLIGRVLKEAMPELAGQGVFERFDEAFSTAQRVERPAFPVRLAAGADGGLDTRWLHQVIQPWCAQGGAVAGVITFAYDVTEQVEARRLSERRKDTIDFALDAGGVVGTWDWIVPDDVVMVDSRFARLFGIPPEEIEHGVGLERFVAGIHGADQERVRTAIAEAVVSGGDYHQDYRVRDADGRLRWVTARGRCFRDCDGTSMRFPGVVADVTELVEAREKVVASEAALRTSEDRRRRAMEAGQVGTFEFYPEEARAVWDPMTVEIFGFDPGEDVALEHIRSLIHPDDRPGWEAELAAALDPAGSGFHRLEMRIRRTNDGQTRWIEARGRTTFEDGRPTLMLGTIRDVTERRRYEEQLDLSNRELRHRVKNLFAVVQGLILTSARGETDVPRFVEKLRARVDALAAAHIVGIADEQLTSVPLRELIEAVLRPYERDDSAVAITGPDISLPQRFVTPLGLVMHELATNAAKHGVWSTGEGRLDISWETVEKADRVVLEVTWSETSAALGAPVARREPGFGSRLIEGSLRQINGHVERSWLPQGLQVRLSAPISLREDG